MYLPFLKLIEDSSKSNYIDDVFIYMFPVIAGTCQEISLGIKNIEDYLNQDRDIVYVYYNNCKYLLEHDVEFESPELEKVIKLSVSQFAPYVESAKLLNEKYNGKS